MAKIFFIREVDELMTNKIKEMALAAILTEPIEGYDKGMEAITAVRHYKDFAKLVIDSMREMEADEDRWIEKYRCHLSEENEEAPDGTDS